MFDFNEAPPITDADLAVAIAIVAEREEAQAAWLAAEAAHAAAADRADLDAMLAEEVQAQQDLRWACKG